MTLTESLYGSGAVEGGQVRKAGVPGVGFGARETGARGSRVSQHSAHACGSAIGRAILEPDDADDLMIIAEFCSLANAEHVG